MVRRVFRYGIRSATMLGVALALLVVAIFIVAAINNTGGSSSSPAEPCLVVVTGNKVCGADAAAWCRASEGLRAGGSSPQIRQTQADCNRIEAEYP